MLLSQKAQVPVDRETLDDRDDQRNRRRQSYGADFWPMTLILTVIVIASLVALGRLAEHF